MTVFELKWLYKATFLKSQVVKRNDEMEKNFFYNWDKGWPEGDYSFVDFY